MNFETVKASFNTYFVDVLKNQYVDFAGRATRTQFWMFYLYVVIAVLAISIVSAIIHLPILSLLASLAVLVPFIAIAVRRIRDLGISGWFILVGFIPFIGGLLVLVGYCLPTDFMKPYAEQITKNLKK